MEALLEQGHEVHYVSIKKFPILHKNCYFHRFPWPEKYSDNLLFWGVFLSLLFPMLLYISIKCRIHCLYTFSTTYGICQQPVKILLGIPLFVFLRADVITNYTIQGKSKLLIRAEQCLEGIAIYKSYVYGVSEVLTKEILSRHRYLKPASFGVLRNNIDVCANHENSSRNYKIPLRLSCAGIFEVRKNQEFLIKLISKLNSPDICLTLYGVGPLENRLRDIAKNTRSKSDIRFKGWTPVEDIMQNTDLMLVPSLHEGAPNIVLECLSYEVPVIASNIPEHMEILHADCLFTLDLDSWLAILEDIIKDPESILCNLNKKLDQSRKMLSFDWKKMFNAIVSE